MNYIRSEKGYRLWNEDLSNDENKLEEGMDLIWRDDGDYVGKDDIDIIKKKGLKKKMELFKIKEKIKIWGMEEIWRDEKVVG